MLLLFAAVPPPKVRRQYYEYWLQALNLEPGDPVLQENLRQAEKMAAAYPEP